MNRHNLWRLSVGAAVVSVIAETVSGVLNAPIAVTFFFGSAITAALISIAIGQDS